MSGKSPNPKLAFYRKGPILCQFLQDYVVLIRILISNNNKKILIKEANVCSRSTKYADILLVLCRKELNHQPDDIDMHKEL